MAHTKIADVVDDRNHQMLYKLSKLVAFPDFAKNSAILETDAIAKLPITVFADPVNRKFPCHTKAATWLAQLYFLESRSNYPTRQAQEVQDRIAKVAAYFSISEMVKQARTTWESHNKISSELTDSDYAMVFDEAGTKTRKLPISNTANVQAAAKHLYEKRANYTFDLRNMAARRILNKAGKLNAQLDGTAEEYLQKAAGFGGTTPVRAAEKLSLRTLMMPTSDTEYRIKTARLASAISKMPNVPNAVLTKLAQIVDQIDERYKFHQRYVEGIDTPEELFFELTEKKASAVKDAHVVLTTGTVIPISMLDKLPLDKLASALGDDFIKAITADDSLEIDAEKFARIVPTLPRNDALLLERAIKAAGEVLEQPVFDSVVD